MASWTTPVDSRATGYTVSAGDWDVAQDNLAYLYGDTGWVSISTWSNGWGAFAGSIPRYRRFGNAVFLQGKIAGGTVGSSTAFTLPSGYFPTQTQTFATVAAGNVLGRLEVLSTGAAEIVVGSTTWTAIDVSFLIL